ncbi:MAG TPA: SGNH/GDSL hydrolase family protein [Ramlibacter sp.]|nr:SGNH/GDSL hydrolase family protein [Ramlibacter sp.]
MSCNWTRRAFVALASASALLLAACGSGTIESQLQPTRIVSFGDGLSDVGQGGTRYTVNDGSVNIWTLQVASSFAVSLTAQSAGGTSYATGNARVVAKPDAAGGTATFTVKEQIDAFLAAGTLGSNDLIVVNAGTADVIAEMQQALKVSPTQSSAQALANVQQAGRDLGAQVRRLVQAGGKHVVVVGTYHLGRSPWATAIGQTSLLTEASSKFNEEMLVSIVDLGANVLYVDAALLFNLMQASPSSYGLTNATDVVCTSIDPGNGIGIGTGQVNSAQCTTSTILTGAAYAGYMFADAVYLGPEAHRKFGEYAYSRIRDRW